VRGNADEVLPGGQPPRVRRTHGLGITSVHDGQAARRAVGHDSDVDDGHRLEVHELTEMLQTEPLFIRPRAWLDARGIDVATVRLAGLIDNADGVAHDGDGKSIGVLVIPPGRVFEFEGDIYESPGEHTFRRDELSLSDAARNWPAVAAAIESM